MSFSGKVKEELSQQWSSARHCQIAEIAALIGMCGAVTINSFNQYGVKINTENLAVARKVFTLIRKTFNIEADISIRRNIEKQSAVYSVMIVRHEDALRVLQAAKLLDCLLYTSHLPLSQAKAGDLVFFHSTYNAGSYVTHVGILVSPTQMYLSLIHI